jgi:hypothetical protein
VKRSFFFKNIFIWDICIFCDEGKNVLSTLWLFINICNLLWTAVAQWVRYCATNHKVAGSIPEGIMEFFIDINPSDRTMAQGFVSASNRNEYREYFLGVNAASA